MNPIFARSMFRSSLPRSQSISRPQSGLLNTKLTRSNPRFNQARFFALEKKDVEQRVVFTLKNFHKLKDGTVEIKTDSSWRDLGLDSLDGVEVVMALEEEFAVEIPNEDAEKINSCADAIKYFVTHPQAK